jgi:hypothetical protein
MSTGTRNFFDDAVDVLAKGRHAFVLLATDPLNAEESRHKFASRFGVRKASDYRMLRELLEEEVIPWLREQEEEAEE